MKKRDDDMQRELDALVLKEAIRLTKENNKTQTSSRIWAISLAIITSLIGVVLTSLIAGVAYFGTRILEHDNELREVKIRQESFMRRHDAHESNLSEFANEAIAVVERTEEDLDDTVFNLTRDIYYKLGKLEGRLEKNE